jgi:hypothetical protein
MGASHADSATANDAVVAINTQNRIIVFTIADTSKVADKWIWLYGIRLVTNNLGIAAPEVKYKNPG